ncbi:MAG: tetratricopeptide repeat protein [Nitrospirae bacterium]|nr:tetratricopeptide repeat protein [Nitrospirota bacterium]
MEQRPVIKLPWGIPSLLLFWGLILIGGGESEASALYVTPIEPPAARVEIPIQVPKGTLGEAEGAYQEGLSLYNAGNYPDAASRWGLILEKAPNSKGGEAAAFLVGEAHFIAAVSRLADIRTFASRSRAERMKKAGEPDWAPALNAFQRATREYPESPWFPVALYRMGESYRQMGFLVEARGSFLRIVREFPDSPYSPKALIAAAGIALQEGKFKEAEGIFQKVFQRYPEAPDLPAAVFGAADALFFQREFGEAQRSYHLGLERWPAYLKAHPDTLFRYGETVFQNGEWAQAREAFFSLYNLYPGYEQAGFALNRIGDSYRLEGRIPTARKFYEEVLLLYGEGELPLQTRITLGTLEEQKAASARGDRAVDRETAYDAAMAYFQQVSEAALPIAGEAVLRMGRIQEQRGDPEGAVRLYQRLLESPVTPGGEGAVTPEYREEAIRSVSRILKEVIESRLGKGRDEEGVAVYQRHRNLMREHVRDLPLLRAMAETHHRVGLYAEANALYQILLDTEGKEGGPDLFAQGENYFAAGDPDGVLRSMESYRSRFPGGEYRERADYRILEALHRKGDFTGMTALVERDGIGSGFPSRIALILSEAYRRGEQPAKAREVLTKSLSRFSGKLSSEEAALYAELGDLAAAEGDYQTAGEFYRKGGLAAAAEEDLDFFRLMTARALMKTGQSGKAGEMFTGLAASRSEVVRRAAETWREEIPNGAF